MKRKGFTLIELLAVIVVLAIIALIATPTILGVIEKARRGTAEQSALGYVDAVEMQVSLNSLDLEKEDIKDGVYTVIQLKELEVSIKGQSPSDESWVKIKNGRVVAYSLKFGRYTITLDENGNKEIEKDGEVIKKPDDDNTTNPDNPDDSNDGKKYPVYSNGTAIYFDPETNEKCNESEAVSITGTKTGCMKWYTFNDEGEDSSTVNMILDHNTTGTLLWDNNTNVAYEHSKIRLEVNQLVFASGWSVTPRLITANEVAKITENINFDSTIATTSNWFYFDSNSHTKVATSQVISKYAWLYDYTLSCKSSGCNVAASSSTVGYWTSTPTAGSGYFVWYVSSSGKLDVTRSNNSSNPGNGIRPVITVSKSVIS